MREIRIFNCKILNDPAVDIEYLLSNAVSDKEFLIAVPRIILRELESLAQQRIEEDLELEASMLTQEL